MNFTARVDVYRLVAEEKDIDAIGYTADIKINCAECGLLFEFVGMPAGFSQAQPMVNFDSTTARVPLIPSRDPVEQIKAMQ